MTDFLEDGLVGYPCSPRTSQESSPTPQFKSINSSVLSFLYSPTLKSMDDYWKSHSFDCMDVRVGLYRRLSAEELMILKCGVGEDS